MKVKELSSEKDGLRVPQEPVVDEAKEPLPTPIPTATGNKHLAILRHDIVISDSTADRGRPDPAGVSLAISNTSGRTIATALFEAVFYDIGGCVLDRVRHREVDLKPDASRAIQIHSSIPDRDRSERDRIRSYDVRVIRTATADVEKVQICRHESTTNEAGEEVIAGTFQNLSDLRASAVVFATFYDHDGERIGTKATIFPDVEPNSIRRFTLGFKPQEGDAVRTYDILVGEI